LQVFEYLFRQRTFIVLFSIIKCSVFKQVLHGKMAHTRTYVCRERIDIKTVCAIRNGPQTYVCSHTSSKKQRTPTYAVLSYGPPGDYWIVRINIGSPFLGVKRGRGVTQTTQLHVVLRSRMSRSCTACPASLAHGVAGQRDRSHHPTHSCF